MACRNRRAFTLIEALVVLAILGLVIALLLPAIQSARESARRIQCSNNCAQVGKAVQIYASATDHFPPGVIRWISWNTDLECKPCVQVEFSLFVRILPELEHQWLFDSFNFHNAISEPRYDGAHPRSILFEEDANTTAISTRLAILLCPSDQTPEPTRSASTNLRSNEGVLPGHFQNESSRFAGPATPISVSTIRKEWARVTYANSSKLSSTVGSVTDGLSNTALLSEKLRGTENRSGRPFRFDPRRHYAIPWKGLGSDYAESNDEAIRICNDPSTKFFGFETNTGLVWAIGSIRNGAYNHVAPPNPPYSDCISELGRIEPSGIASARSQHPGGINVGMADGSVRFVRNGVTLNLWRAIGTKAGGEPISDDGY